MRTRCWPVAPVLFASLLLAPRVHAAPFTAHFAALVTELQARAAGQGFSAAQQKAITKALALVDKPSASLAADVRTAGKVVKPLKRAFGPELAGSTGLGGLVGDLVTAFRAEVTQVAGTLGGHASGLAAGGCKNKVSGLADKVTGALARASGAEAGPDLVALAKALKLAARGEKAAAKCPAGGGACTDTNTLVVTVDGADWTPASAGFFRATDVNSLVVIGNDAGPPSSQVSIVVHGVTGMGTYDVEPGCDYVRNDDSTFSVPSGSVSTGTLTLQGFTYTDDGVLNDCFRGSFDVTFTNGAATKHVQGTFDLSKLPAL